MHPRGLETDRARIRLWRSLFQMDPRGLETLMLRGKRQMLVGFRMHPTRSRNNTHMETVYRPSRFGCTRVVSKLLREITRLHPDPVSDAPTRSRNDMNKFENDTSAAVSDAPTWSRNDNYTAELSTGEKFRMHRRGLETQADQDIAVTFVVSDAPMRSRYRDSYTQSDFALKVSDAPMRSRNRASGSVKPSRSWSSRCTHPVSKHK